MAGPIGITDAKILAMKPPHTGQDEIADQVVRGLRVRIGASGIKTFILRKRVGGRVRNITLGRYGPRFGLVDARRKARGLLVDIESGKDPTVSLATPRKGGATAGTVKALWEQYRDQEVRGKKRTAREIERTFDRYIIPKIGDRLADSITRGDVTALVEGVTFADATRPTPRMGRAVQQQLSSFYSWAMPKLDRLPANPCRDAGRPAASKARDRYLNEVEIKAFWKACDALGHPFGPGFRLLLLTGQRRGELFDADWSEFQGDLWTIPAERAKNGITHLVPLPEAAKAILDALPRSEGATKLFPARSQKQGAEQEVERGASGFSKGLARLHREMLTILKADDDKIEQVKPFTLHDLRRTMATGMQRIGIALPVVEAALNHVAGSRAGVAGVYQRHHYLEEKRHAMTMWAAEVVRVVASSESDRKGKASS
jgi:integrase